MHVEVGPVSGEVEFEEGTEQVSPHTGKLLRVGEIEVELREDSPAIEHMKQGSIIVGDGIQWLVKRRIMRSSRGNSPVSTYRFAIEEYERREADALRVEDLELKPEQYVESASDGAVTIKARVSFERDDARVQVLRNLLTSTEREAVNVVRVGVSGEPREMTIEAVVWSKARRKRCFDLELADVDTREPSVPSD